MPTKVPKQSIARARRLRRDMTEGERRLWSELKTFRASYGVHVRKQAPIGIYFVDFAIHEHRLVIEVDGEHHLTSAGMLRDKLRDERLAELGYRVIRFNTGELSESFDGCIIEVLRELGLLADGEAPPPPTPSLERERDQVGTG